MLSDAELWTRPPPAPRAAAEVAARRKRRGELRARRLLARLVYVRSLALACAEPERGAVVAELARLVDEPTPRGRAFAAESSTAALLRAVRSPTLTPIDCP